MTSFAYILLRLIIDQANQAGHVFYLIKIDFCSYITDIYADILLFKTSGSYKMIVVASVTIKKFRDLGH